jgi:hypothetical protein
MTTSELSTEWVLSPLYVGENATVDIVAIETLTESRLESWQKEHNGRPVLWLKDPEFLPSRIGDCRVFSFGYTLENNFPLELLADALLKSISENRHEDEVDFLKRV